MGPRLSPKGTKSSLSYGACIPAFVWYFEVAVASSSRFATIRNREGATRDVTRADVPRRRAAVAIKRSVLRASPSLHLERRHSYPLPQCLDPLKKDFCMGRRGRSVICSSQTLITLSRCSSEGIRFEMTRLQTIASLDMINKSLSYLATRFFGYILPEY